MTLWLTQWGWDRSAPPPCRPPAPTSRAQEFQAPSGEEGGFPTSIRLASQPFQPDLPSPWCAPLRWLVWPPEPSRSPCFSSLTCAQAVGLQSPLCRSEAYPSVKVWFRFLLAVLPPQKRLFASEKTTTESQNQMGPERSHWIAVFTLSCRETTLVTRWAGLTHWSSYIFP